MTQTSRFTRCGLALAVAMGCGEGGSVAPSEDGGVDARVQDDAAPPPIEWASCSLIEGADDGLAQCATVPPPRAAPAAP